LAKYTREQLKEMALEMVVDANAGGLLSFQVIITMSTVMGIDPEIVWERVREFARYEAL